MTGFFTCADVLAPNDPQQLLLVPGVFVHQAAHFAELVRGESHVDRVQLPRQPVGRAEGEKGNYCVEAFRAG